MKSNVFNIAQLNQLQNWNPHIFVFSHLSRCRSKWKSQKVCRNSWCLWDVRYKTPSISIFEVSQKIECTFSISRGLFVSYIVKVTGNELVVKNWFEMDFLWSQVFGCFKLIALYLISVPEGAILISPGKLYLKWGWSIILLHVSGYLSGSTMGCTKFLKDTVWF